MFVNKRCNARYPMPRKRIDRWLSSNGTTIAVPKVYEAFLAPVEVLTVLPRTHLAGNPLAAAAALDLIF